MADGPATATGTLAKTPMPHLLVYALDRSLTGTLVFEAPGGARSAVSLVDGAPWKAKTAEPVIYLGRLLLEHGAVDESVLNESLARVAKERRLHGEVLIQMGALTPEQLVAGLIEQTVRKVAWLFSLPGETQYGYYDGVDYLQRFGGQQRVLADPLKVIWRGVRVRCDPARVAATVTRLNGVLRLHPDARADRFGFGREEQAIVDVMRAKPQPHAALLNTGLLSESALNRLLYVLAITRHLDVGADPLGVDAGPPSSSNPESRRANLGRALGKRAAPPPTADDEDEGPPSSRQGARDPAVAAFMKEIRSKAETLDELNHYELLELDPKTPTEEIQAAFLKLAKKWHPDRLGPEYAELKPLANKVFARMSEASQTLTKQDARDKYDEQLESGVDGEEEQAQVHRVMLAATNYEKARVLMQRGRTAEALSHAEQAMADDAGQAEYIGMVAWLRAQSNDRLESGKYDDLLKLMDHAIATQPNNKKVRLWRGQLRKRAGKERLALEDFRWLGEHDPNNVDAQRELRLAKMRRRTSVPPPADEGARKSLFGGLFKKKG